MQNSETSIRAVCEGQVRVMQDGMGDRKVATADFQQPGHCASVPICRVFAIPEPGAHALIEGDVYKQLLIRI